MKSKTKPAKKKTPFSAEEARKKLKGRGKQLEKQLKKAMG